MLFLVAVAPVYGNVASSTSITNAAPAIRSVTTYSNYTNCTNNTPNSTFGPNTTVFIQVNVSDANGYADITDNGYVKIKIAVFDGTTESDFTRFGTSYSLNAAFESGSGVNATYTAAFNMTSADANRLGSSSPSGFYRVKAAVGDGTAVTTSNISASQNADYTYTNSTVAVLSSSFDGSTTNLLVVDVHNVTALVLEKASYAKINFTSTINFTQSIDLSSFVNISQNFISVNSSALPELNKSAVLSFYNLTLADPVILRNGNVCPASICTKVSYADGVLVFNVTGFTNYSATEAYCGDGSCNGGERCSTCQADCGRCSSSSGGVGMCFTNWNCSVWSSCLGGAQARTCSKANAYCFAEQKPETTKTCVEEKKPVSNASGKAVITATENATRAVLFDVDLKLLKKEVSASDGLQATISLRNLGKPGRVSANLYYTISDRSGNIVYGEKQIVDVETQTEFIKSFDVSKLMPGEYELLADLSYEGQKEPAQSADVFVIKAVPSPIGIWPVGGFAIFADEKEFVIFTAFAIIVIAYTVIRMRSKKAKAR